MSMNYATARATIEGITPYSQSRFVGEPRLDNEDHDAFERRCWRKRLHVDRDGYIIIPPSALKNCLTDAATYLSLQIKGKGKQTYTKHFTAGVFIDSPIRLDLKAEDCEYEDLLLNADGRRGGGKRVMRRMPYIPHWGGPIDFAIFDTEITDDVFRFHLEKAGQLIGLGRFRPRNNGYYGRFVVREYKWTAAK